MQHTSAAAGAGHQHHPHHHLHRPGPNETHRIDQGGVSNFAPLAGSEYVSPHPNPDAAYKSSTTTSTTTKTSGAYGPLTDNSNVPYKESDYIEGKPMKNV
jgi:hypothetical protein